MPPIDGPTTTPVTLVEREACGVAGSVKWAGRYCGGGGGARKGDVPVLWIGSIWSSIARTWGGWPANRPPPSDLRTTGVRDPSCRRRELWALLLDDGADLVRERRWVKFAASW